MKFRVHYEIGDPVEVEAATPADAHTLAVKKRNGIVTKVKRVKEQANG